MPPTADVNAEREKEEASDAHVYDINGNSLLGKSLLNSWRLRAAPSTPPRSECPGPAGRADASQQPRPPAHRGVSVRRSLQTRAATTQRPGLLAPAEQQLPASSGQTR